MVWLIASAIAIIGLVAIWAVLSRPHWFVRTAIVGSPLALLAIVPAYDLIMIFLAEITIIATALVGVRWWRARADRLLASGLTRWRFRLIDLFLFTSVIAVLCLLARNITRVSDDFVQKMMYCGW